MQTFATLMPSGANLHDAIGVDVNVLEQQVRSLRGATMPDGSVHD